MGDALGSIGRGAMAVPAAIGHGVGDTLTGLGQYYGGTEANLPWNDQVGRVLVGILAGRDPVALMKLHEAWTAHDQQAMEEPSYATTLAEPGGAAAIGRQHLPVPPQMLMAQAEGLAGPSGTQRTMIPVPLQPGETGPPSSAYVLPPTMIQRQAQTFSEAKRAVPTDPRSKTDVGVTKEGGVTYKGSERDMPLVEQQDDGTIALTPQMIQGLQSGRFELVPHGDGMFQFQENPAAAAGLQKYEQGLAERAGRLGVPYQPSGALPGSDALDLQKTKAETAVKTDADTVKATREEAQKIEGAMGAIRSARGQLDKLKDLVIGPGSALRPEPFGGVIDRGLYSVDQAGKVLGGDARLQRVERLKKITRSTLAKALADQKGNLNVYEQQAIDTGTAGAYDTIPSAEANFQDLADLLDAKEEAIQAGRVLSAPKGNAPPGAETMIALPDGSVTTREALQAELARRLKAPGR